MVVELDGGRSLSSWQVTVSGQEQIGQKGPNSNAIEATPTGSKLFRIIK
jgi:hypothetical protein